MKNTFSFYVLIIAIFFSIISPNFLSEGMFFDGVFYANFSKVMGLHYSGFWNLKDCESCVNLYGHLPLAIYLESIIFRLFGDSIYNERFYSLITYLISGILIHLIFREISNKKQYSWIALFLWIIIPVVTWAVSNNMLENTMTVFVLSSVLFSLKNIKTNSFVSIFFSGLSIFLAFLSKGVVAFFPLSVFLWFYLFKEITLGEFIKKSTSLLLSTLFFFLLIFIFSDNGTNYIINYYNDQLVKAMGNEQTVSSRFNIILVLFNEILPLIGIQFTLFLLFRFSFRVRKLDKVNIKKGLIMFFIGCSGVFPMIISLKQSGFYILPALPFFAMSFALFMLPQIEYLINKYYKETKLFKSISYFFLIFSFVLVLFFKGKVIRDADKLNDVIVISNYVENKTLSIPPKLFWDWSLKSYFYRYGDIELNDNQSNLREYYIIENNHNHENLINYEIVNIALKKYKLYKLDK